MTDRQAEDFHRRLGALYRLGAIGPEPDAELLERFLEGPEPTAEAAFAVLVERHGPMVLRACRRLLDNPHDAEDAAQAAFLLLARRAPAIRRRESVASWLFGVAVRVSRKARVQAARRRRHERRSAERSARPRPADPGDGPPWEELYDALDRLPESLRAPLVLCYLEGMTNEQAADRLGVPLRTLRRRLASGRERLRERLARSGVAAPLAPLDLPGRPPDPIHPGWADRAARSAVAFTSGRLAAGTAPAAAASLAREVLRSMIRTQLAIGSGAALLAASLSLGLLPLVHGRQDNGHAPVPTQTEPPEAAPDAPPPLRLNRPPLPSWATERPRTGPGRTSTFRFVAAETGEPIPFARSRLWIGLNDDWLTADADGLLAIEHSTGPADTSFGIDAWGDGFAMQRHRFGDRPGEPIPDEATIALRPGESLGGVVRDEQGHPVAGAAVFLWSHNYEKADPAELLYDLPAVTGPDGRWRTGGAPRTTGDLRGISIIHPDYISDRQYTSRREIPPIDDFRAGTASSVLTKGAYVEGRVLDADGNPVADALVLSDNRPNTLFAWLRDLAAVTDADGRFRTVQLAPGDWHLIAQAPGHAPTAMELEVGTAIPNVELRLGQPRPLRVRVVDEDGEPIAGTFFNIDTWGPYRCLGVYRWTDAEGRASWDEATDDRILLGLGAPGFLDRWQVPAPTTDEEAVFTLRRALSITGRIRDAETGTRIDRAEVQYGAVDPRTGEVAEWVTRGEAQLMANDGALMVGIPIEADAYKIRITANGYAPFVSRVFRSDEIRVLDYNVTLQPQPGGGAVATVRFPGGEPLADALVLIGREERSLHLLDGAADDRYGNVNTGLPLRTDADGSVPIPPTDQPYVAVVVGDRGYAIASSGQLAESGEVHAQPFARVEGRYLIGDRPGANLPIVLSARIQDTSTAYVGVHSEHEAVTDADGRFTFEKVIPMEGLRVSRREAPGTPGWLWSLGEPVRVAPGETARITYGGVGRPVVGRVTPPMDWTEPVDFTKQSTAIVAMNRPQAPYPPELFRGKTSLEGGYTSDWWRDWRASPEARAYSESARRFIVGLAPDGTFRVDDVPPGEYRLVVAVGEGASRASPGPFASLSRTFTVPEDPGGRSDEPVTFDTLRLRRRTTLDAGDPAPSVEVTIVSGEVLSLPGDFRGRYLLLDLGTPANDQSRFQIARVNGLHERFGDDDRLAMLSLLVAGDDDSTRAFIAAKGQPWPQAILGPLPNPVAEAFGVEDSSIGSSGTLLPGLVLIGPDGDVLAVDFHGDAIVPLLSRALGR